MKHLNNLDPEFKPLAEQVLAHVSHFCKLLGCTWYIASSYRTPEEQWDLYKKGRKKVGVDWVRIPGKRVVTNATPGKTPHCLHRDGKPAACAIDIALVEDGAWLPDDDPRWCIVGMAVSLTGHEKLTWGGMWRSLRDMPHVELIGWREER